MPTVADRKIPNLFIAAPKSWRSPWSRPPLSAALPGVGESLERFGVARQRRACQKENTICAHNRRNRVAVGFTSKIRHEKSTKLIDLYHMPHLGGSKSGSAEARNGQRIVAPCGFPATVFGRVRVTRARPDDKQRAALDAGVRKETMCISPFDSATRRA